MAGDKGLLLERLDIFFDYIDRGQQASSKRGTEKSKGRKPGSLFANAEAFAGRSLRTAAILATPSACSWSMG